MGDTLSKTSTHQGKKTAELWTLLGERLKALCTLRVKINKTPLIQTDPVSTKTLLGCFYPGVLRELEWRIQGLRMKKELPYWLSSKESACQYKRPKFNPRSREIPHGTEQLGVCTTAIEPAH